MRKLTLPLAATAALASLYVSPATALTSVNANGLRLAMKTMNPIETVACWRYGWRGWGVYPGCYRAVYVAPPVVYAPPVDTPAHVRCVWRTVRVWTGYSYVVRRVRRCW